MGAMLRWEFPPLMDQLLDILALEKESRFLPPDVLAIVLRLKEVRRSIFNSSREAHQRLHLDLELIKIITFYSWINENDTMEISTQFYPNWRLLRLPKKYTIRYK